MSDEPQPENESQPTATPPVAPPETMQSNTNAEPDQNPPAPAAPEPAPPEPVKVTAGLYPLGMPVEPELAAVVQTIEQEIGLECWLFFTGSMGIEPVVYDLFVAKLHEMPKKPIALIVDSDGGYGETAYRISRLLQKRCGGFTAIVPRRAKSAATLMVLGANDIILGEVADLGPLDAQFHDYDEEERQVSALDTVQAVEALEDSAVKVGIKMLKYLQENTGKRYSLLIEPSLKFAAEITKPLFEKIDAVRYTRQSRILREAQDYAERLLRHRFTEEEANAISLDLVQNYPAHGFVIDYDEAKRLGRKPESVVNRSVGLHVSKPATEELSRAMNKLGLILADQKILMFGKLSPAGDKGKKT